MPSAHPAKISAPQWVVARLTAAPCAAARFAAAALLVVALLTGCDGSRPNAVPVSGRVTLNGEPLAGANVNFQPIADKGAPETIAIGSYGRTDANGHYTLKLVNPDLPGALVGKHRVTVSTAVLENSATDSGKLSVPERVPARYRDGRFELQVPAGGTDQADIKIRTK